MHDVHHHQDLAEHLVTHGHRLSSMDHKELSSVFRLGQRSCRWAMDQLVALAMANLDIPQSWNVLGSPGGEGEVKNSLSLVPMNGFCADTDFSKRTLAVSYPSLIDV